MKKHKNSVYKEILELDVNMDIETVLEHLIEEQIIEAVYNSKKDEREEGCFDWVDYPKQKWLINEKKM